LELQDFKDVFKKRAAIEFESLDTTGFLTFDKNSRKFSTFGEPIVMCEFEGVYKAKMFLTDSADKTIGYDIEIAVTKEEEKQSVTIDGSWTPPVKLPPPVPKI